MEPAMSDKVLNVLFLCTGNSARSILAESALNRRGGNFRAFSAGSHPKGTVNPDAIALLERIGYPIEGLHSKGWEAFSEPDSPSWISYSPFATTQRAKSVRSGRDTR
jgi:arsenate reductase